jgi:hypothetical protein
MLSLRGHDVHRTVKNIQDHKLAGEAEPYAG